MPERNNMKLDFGTLKFNNEKEYYYSLGVFCNNHAFSISYEPNKATGSYADAYRMRMLATAKNIIDPINAALRSGNRINCNNYVDTLIKEHNFIQNGKVINGSLENVIKTVPQKYLNSFIDGYTNSSDHTKSSIVMYEAENINSTANSLKKVAIPKSRAKASPVSPPKSKNKHDYIKESIKNANIGERGEKLVFEHEKNKLKAAIKDGKVVPDDYPKWVSLDDDSAGYDILSYDVDAMQPMYIEVKTTTGSKYTPFYMSAGEIDFSKKNASQYHLLRIYNIKNAVAEYYELMGDISTSTEVQIDTVNYLVSIK